jgi:glycosyltransferase involved in cell wall biosynthesis
MIGLGGKLRLFLEVSHTHHHKLKTGIQRVVRMLAKELEGAANENGFEFQLVITDIDGVDNIRVLDLEEFLTGREKYVIPPSPEVAFVSPRYLFLKKVWRIFKKVDFLNILSSTWLRKFSNKIIDYIFRSELSKKSHSEHDELRFKSGDVLLLADAFWAPPFSSLAIAKKANREGAKVIALINDVFPNSHPEYVDPPNVRNFTELVPKVFGLSNGILFPSYSTKKDLERFYFPEGIGVPNSKIHYGAEIGETGWLYEDAPRKPRSILMVGTIEPRKNYGLVLKWFLTRADTKTRLTIIGKNGWMNNSLISAIERERHKNKRFAKKFTWLESATDDDLAYHLQTNEVGIMASHAEGLGLPVLEYSRNGLKLVLNDIPIFREVAGEAAIYFDGKSVDSLDEAINDAFSQREIRSIPEVKWEDTAREIMGFITKNF